MKTIATICARAGSKGLPGKNIRPFAGMPLIVHTIKQASRCSDIDGVYVSTDCPEIAAVARDAGALVPYMRPAELATDEAPKLPVIEHLVRHLERTMQVARIVDLQPTSPLRDSGDIANALRIDGDLIVSVGETRDNPYFTTAERDGAHIRLCKGSGHDRRQDAPTVYALNGSIYVWRREALAHAAVYGLWSVPVTPYVMPRWKCADIDDLEDFERAEWVYRERARSYVHAHCWG